MWLRPWIHEEFSHYMKEIIILVKYFTKWQFSFNKWLKNSCLFSIHNLFNKIMKENECWILKDVTLFLFDLAHGHVAKINERNNWAQSQTKLMKIVMKFPRISSIFKLIVSASPYVVKFHHFLGLWRPSGRGPQNQRKGRT